MDKYITGEVNRISPEAPIPVLRVKSERLVLGGAANVAGNVCGYHVPTFLAGVVGSDKYGDDVLDMLSNKQIRFSGVISLGRLTTIKSRVIAMSQQLVRVDKEDIKEITAEEEEELLNNIVDVLPNVSVVVLSDYNKGVCTDTLCKKLITLCHDTGVKVIVDPKSSDWTKYMNADLITPNFKEFQETVNGVVETMETAIGEACQNLFIKYHLNSILITRSQYGMTLARRDELPITYHSIQQEVFDVSGAGDTVIGTIAALLAEGLPLTKAIEISNFAAGLSVSKVGTYTVTVEEVIEYINQSGQWYQSKIISRAEIKRLVDDWKKHGEKIVFTNGCFDIVHVGHVEYLNKARLLGSKMIVGLNSDESVKRLKGSQRPINSQNARAELLAAFQCVDAVVVFEEDTPENLLSDIGPDFLVKGGDYALDDIVGRQYAGEVRIIPFTKGYSTTNIIERIKEK